MKKLSKYLEFTPYIITAIGLIIIAILAWSYAYSKGYHASDEYHQADTEAQARNKDNYERCRTRPSVSEAIDCYDTYIRSDREHQTAEQDLNTQRQMADWSEGMLWTSIIGLLVTSLGTLFVVLTLREARKTTAAAFRSADAADKALIEAQKSTVHAENSVNLAKDALFATDRAWIEIICEAASEMVFKEDNIDISIKYIHRNIGNSPAINVSIGPPKIFTDASTAFDVLQDSIDICKRTEIYNSLINNGIPMFPDQAATDMAYLVLETNEFVRRIEEIDESQRDDAIGLGTLSPTILIFASYRLPGDKRNRITGIMFSIRWAGLHGVGFDAKEKVVPINMLDISPTGFGSYIS